MVKAVLFSPAGLITAALALDGMPMVVPALPIAVAGSLPATATSPAPTQASSSLSGVAATGGHRHCSNNDGSTERSGWAGGPFQYQWRVHLNWPRPTPTVPKSLFDKFQWWEFMDLAELLLSQSTHNQMIAAQSNFSWFELVHPTRRQIESITEFSKAYMVYTAVLLKRFPKQASELLAYRLLIIKAASTRAAVEGLRHPFPGVSNGVREPRVVQSGCGPIHPFFTGKA